MCYSFTLLFFFQSCVKIHISTHGYDAVCRTPLIIHVGEKSLKCICRDGKVMNMSYEPQELRDLIFCHINQHQILAVQALAKTMGWQALGNSNHLGLYCSCTIFNLVPTFELRRAYLPASKIKLNIFY